MFIFQKRFNRSIRLSGVIFNNNFYKRENNDWQIISKEYVLHSDENDFSVNLPEDMMGGNYNVYRQLLRGYFISYDSDQSAMVLRTSLPGSNLYRDISISLKTSDIVYCWSNYRDGVDVRRLFFDLINPPIISLPEEKTLVFESVAKYLDNNSFFIVQLDQDVQLDQINKTTKVVWLCE